jgi:DNA-directed RNA polymerase specialized sigma24 family protein
MSKYIAMPNDHDQPEWNDSLWVGLHTELRQREFRIQFEKFTNYAISRGVWASAAEEVVGDALLAAYKSFDPSKGKFSAFWFIKLTGRINNMYRRQLKFSDRFIGSLDALDPETVAQITQPGSCPHTIALNSAMTWLKPKDAELLRLHYHDGLSLKQIKALPGVWSKSISGLKMRLKRARQLLKLIAPAVLEGKAPPFGTKPALELSLFSEATYLFGKKTKAKMEYSKKKGKLS